MNLQTHGAWLHYTYRVWMSLQGIPEFKENNKKRGWESQQASLGNLSDILLFSWGKSQSASQQRERTSCVRESQRGFTILAISRLLPWFPSRSISVLTSYQPFACCYACHTILTLLHLSIKNLLPPPPPLDFFFFFCYSSQSYMCRGSFNGKESLSATLL